MSVNVITKSSSQDYTHQNDHTYFTDLFFFFVHSQNVFVDKRSFKIFSEEESKPFPLFLNLHPWLLLNLN